MDNSTDVADWLLIHMCILSEKCNYSSALPNQRPKGPGITVRQTGVCPYI